MGYIVKCKPNLVYWMKSYLKKRKKPGREEWEEGGRKVAGRENGEDKEGRRMVEEEQGK